MLSLVGERLRRDKIHSASSVNADAKKKECDIVEMKFALISPYYVFTLDEIGATNVLEYYEELFVMMSDNRKLAARISRRAENKIISHKDRYVLRSFCFSL